VQLGCPSNGTGLRESDVFGPITNVAVGTPALGVSDYVVPWNATAPEFSRTTIPSTTCRLRSYSASFSCSWFDKAETGNVAAPLICQTTPERRDTFTYNASTTIPNPSVVTEMYEI
jgi:hypothetical protein